MAYGQERIIPLDKSVIIASDVSPEQLSALVDATCTVEGIGGYKVGLELALTDGLPTVVTRMRDHTELPIVYDHQKGGTDIPEMGSKFARVCKRAGVDAVILFPFGGAKTERDWIHACQDQDLGVIVGAHMTQPEFLEKDGGFVGDIAPYRIFRIAAEEGVRDFVVPGNQRDVVAGYQQFLSEIIWDEFSLYAPGFVAQGGNISEVARVAGHSWHAIVGRGIYGASDPHQAAIEMTQNIR